jgi:hypothetical protein
MSGILLVTQLVLTSYVFGTLLHMLQVCPLGLLASYLSPVKYSHSVWHPIGHQSRIFTLSGNLLVTCEVYSLCLASYWSPVKYIHSVWHPIGDVLQFKDNSLEVHRDRILRSN